VPSSVIQMMIYDSASQVLEIVYRGGRGTYRYFDVPMVEWTAFTGAPSKGTYLNEVFKAKDFRYEKVQRGQVSRMPKGSLRWPRAEIEARSES
jgi:hypothetical protein